MSENTIIDDIKINDNNNDNNNLIDNTTTTTNTTSTATTSTSSLQRCDTHNKKQRFICFDCNQIICALCLAAQHTRHDFDQVENIKLQCDNSGIKYQRFTSRLNSLWDTLQKLAWSYETMQTSQKMVADQFTELHHFLVVEEQRIKKPLILELEQTTSTIKCIIDEIERLTSQTQTEPNPPDNAADDEMDSIDRLVESINSSESMEQFLNNSFLPGDEAAFMRCTDNQLLAFVQRGSRSLSTVYKVTNPYRVDTMTFKLNDVKEHIRLCFELVEAKKRDPARSPTHSFNNHIFTSLKDSCAMLSLDTGKWIKLNDAFTNRRRIYESAVYARGCVYIFGGDGAPTTYSRYSLTEQQWLNDIEIVGVPGGRSISSCYDGGNLIYLVGGCFNEKMLDRIDCFNLDTLQFSRVGRMPLSLANPHTLIHDTKLYIVGGYQDVSHPNKNIYMCSLQTKVCTVFMESAVNGWLFACCFDGKDQLTMTVGLATIRLSLTTKLSRTIASSPITNNYYHLVYTTSNDIIQLGGTGNNYRYSKLNDQWIPINDDDPVPTRMAYSTCLIRDD
ncbi:hypothetical protein SAMD00019534_078860 [Acytostelium subglobosum LB1]|uniref:hypothetical protein n=1 Tax=Acytostelium subglobosum LB1 TaxID=1410327 RepID=UPI000644DD4E|nr:hypothetical protein SAMD00019534_078860 [Acytostelium subglobosum LB1]GAM24711.1 hypothetical protein SAMD00019534_078860 [Acytostelium subglobosum LB1]|eukprot:XP_012752380.1 hypothetical protein SAMD00019534_078860 [Acytostelium subglobosum LB1]